MKSVKLNEFATDWMLIQEMAIRQAVEMASVSCGTADAMIMDRVRDFCDQHVPPDENELRSRQSQQIDLFQRMGLLSIASSISRLRRDSQSEVLTAIQSRLDSPLSTNTNELLESSRRHVALTQLLSSWINGDAIRP